jgi:hypothetical protein
MVSMLRTALGGHPGLQWATRFTGQSQSVPKKPDPSEADASSTPIQGDQFEKLSAQVAELHEGQEMFYSAFQELDIRTSILLENQSRMIQLLNQLVQDRSKGQPPAQSASPKLKMDRRS